MATLTEDKRQQLDGIVERALADGLGDADVQAIVDDFKTRHSTNEKEPVPMPGGRAERIAAHNPSLSERVSGAIGEASGVPGVVVGAAKNALEGVGQLGQLARKVPGVDLLDRIFAPIQIDTSAKNPDQALGKKAETIAELAGALPRAAVGAGRAVVRALPSAERAGAAINAATDAAQAAGVTIDVAPVMAQAERIRELASRGGVMPKAVRNLLQHGDKPFDFQTARDFYSNLSRLSANEFQKLTPALQRELANLRTALGEAIQAGAEKAGKGAEYAGALKEYAGAMKNQDRADYLWNLLKDSAANAVKYGPAAAATGAGWKLWNGK